MTNDSFEPIPLDYSRYFRPELSPCSLRAATEPWLFRFDTFRDLRVTADRILGTRVSPGRGSEHTLIAVNGEHRDTRGVISPSYLRRQIRRPQTGSAQDHSYRLDSASSFRFSCSRPRFARWSIELPYCVSGINNDRGKSRGESSEVPRIATDFPVWDNWKLLAGITSVRM